MISAIIPVLNEVKTIGYIIQDIYTCSTNSLLDTVAGFVIKGPDFNLLIPIIQ